MPFAWVTCDDWLEFDRRWKDASAFLLRADLMGELAHLESMASLPKSAMSRNQWDRLWELRQLSDDTRQIDKRLGAGVPYTFPAQPETGKWYYCQHDGRLYRVQIVGRDGDFDRIPRWKFIWLTGPNKGRTDSSYSQIFWRPVLTIEDRRAMWSEMNEWEQAKHIGLFPEPEFTIPCPSCGGGDLVTKCEVCHGTGRTKQ